MYACLSRTYRLEQARFLARHHRTNSPWAVDARLDWHRRGHTPGEATTSPMAVRGKELKGSRLGLPFASRIWLHFSAVKHDISFVALAAALHRYDHTPRDRNAGHGGGISKVFFSFFSTLESLLSQMSHLEICCRPQWLGHRSNMFRYWTSAVPCKRQGRQNPYRAAASCTEQKPVIEATSQRQQPLESCT